MGHYIWYPKVKQKYVESFPNLIKFACSNGYSGSLPKEIGYTGGDPVLGPCPWNNKAEFNKAKEEKSKDLENIQKFLIDKDMQKQQALFQYNRLLDFMDNWKPGSNQDEIAAKNKAEELMKQPGGTLVLMDYINFKGEGTNPSEFYMYNNKKMTWGLKSVLQNWVELEKNPKYPNIKGVAISAFSWVANQVLGFRSIYDPEIKKQDNPGKISVDWMLRVNDYSNISTAQSKYNCK